MILDLTHCISPEMPVYPGTEQPVLTTACTIREAGYRETILHMYSHTGTHMDAPAHMIEGGRTLDAFPAETFVGPGFVLDCGKFPCPCSGPMRTKYAGRTFCSFAPAGINAGAGRNTMRTFPA